jgi:hypothetical protein
MIAVTGRHAAGLFMLVMVDVYVPTCCVSKFSCGLEVVVLVKPPTYYYYYYYHHHYYYYLQGK